MTHDIVIVGAGAAGLGAAHEARALGLSHKAVEASSRIGGRAVTVNLDFGQPFDLGCHWMQGGDRNPFYASVTAETTLGPVVQSHTLWRNGCFTDEAVSTALDDAFEALSAAHLEHQRRPAQEAAIHTEWIDDGLIRPSDTRTPFS